MFPSPLRRAGDFFCVNHGARAAAVDIESGGTTATSIYRWREYIVFEKGNSA